MKNGIPAKSETAAIPAVARPSPYDLELAEDIRLDQLADDAWDEAASGAEIDALKARVRADALAALGRFPARTPLDVRKVGELKFDGYRVEKLLFASRPNYHVTAHLYLPDAPAFKPPYPAILMPCGHDAEGKNEPVHARSGVVAAQAGFAALLCDPVDEGERRQRDGDGTDNIFGHRAAGLRAHLLGQSFAMYRIWDGMRALDLLCSRADIDPKRIGAAGYSGGGTMTAYMGIFDDRVCAVCPAAFITSISELARKPGPQDSEQVIFGQLGFGLNHRAILQLISPKPILVGCSHDDFFPYAGCADTFAKVAAFCERNGLADRIDRVECPGGHGWYESERHAAVNWFDKWLNGNDTALPLDRAALDAMNEREKDFARISNPSAGLDCGPGLMTDSEAMCADGNVRRLPGERTIYDLLADEAAHCETNRAPPSPDLVREVAGIRADEPAGNRPETVRCAFAEAADGSVTMAVSDAIAYDRGCKCFWYSLGGPAEELAAMMMWRGENLVALRAGEILRAARRHCRDHASRPVRLRADGPTAIAAAHARFLRPELFSGLELVDPPPSWREALHDPSVALGAADVVFGAYRHYDWVDLFNGHGRTPHARRTNETGD